MVKLISFPEQNIKKLCLDIKNEVEKLNIDYEHIIIDNASTDRTVDILKEICATDKKVKVIINSVCNDYKRFIIFFLNIFLMILYKL